ncbi:SBBP repeat-containing protein [Longitalea luteola]|uniref:SBBP repeat-containing protein n=1 Tax=Longitalea luteola TaxID=2812563 RepID=UPI001A976079|nr:SBBP repeat-containing protein [Longitalea luteola]
MEKLLPIKKLLLLFVFSSSAFCFAQVKQEWVARYNGPQNLYDAGNSLAVDRQGNVYVLGVSAVTETNDDFCTIKYDANGVKQWEARYSGSANMHDLPSGIALDRWGNVYITGMAYENGTGGDYVTIKYNPSGVQQWLVRYSSPGFDRARSIAVDDDGNVHVSGDRGLGGFVTIKYNTNGVQQWLAHYDDNGGGIANAMVIDKAGNVYVVGGSATSLDPDDVDLTTIKYNKNGKQLWVRRYDGPVTSLFNRARAVAVDRKGNVYVTGNSVNSNEDDASDYLTIKYNSKGHEKWVARYNGPGNSEDLPYSIAVDKRQNVYITGSSPAGRYGVNYDFATIRYDKFGKEVWVKRYNGPANGDDQASYLVLDEEANVYVAGLSQGIGTGESDGIIVKYNAAGSEQWIERYNGPTNQRDIFGNFGFLIPNPLVIDKSGNLYVTGASQVADLNFDCITIRYSQASPDSGLVVQQWSPKPSARFHLFNAPNPVNTTTNIYYALPSDGHVSLQVFDMMGRPVAVLVNGNMKAGNYNVNFNTSGLQKGVYNYRLTLKATDKVWVETKKLIVIE